MTHGTNQTIIDRLADKLKSEQFAEWFGEEDLYDLIKQAVDKAFFSPRFEKDQGWGGRTHELPSLAAGYAKEHLDGIVRASVDKAVKEHLVAHPEFIEAILAKQFNGGIQQAILKAFAGFFDAPIQNMAYAMTQEINKGLEGSGRVVNMPSFKPSV